MINISEDEIMKNWAPGYDVPLVSVKCLAYNHEAYIEKCLEGVLSQKTSFPFELVVHDDASPDKTAEIIKRYETRFPHIIKAVYEEENQYSKFDGSIKRILEPYLRGKYIAVCEGDDYWIDPDKLQKQIEYMEQHEDCSFSFTNGYREREGNRREFIGGNISEVRRKNKTTFRLDEIMMLEFIPTASFVFRSDIPLADVKPGSYLGDEYTKMSMLMHGYAYFIDLPMVVYRESVLNSETDKWRKNPEIYYYVCDSFIIMLESIDELTNGEYSETIRMRICEWKINKYYQMGNKQALKQLVTSGEIKTLKKHSERFYLQNLFMCNHYDQYRSIVKCKNNLLSKM